MYQKYCFEIFSSLYIMYATLAYAIDQLFFIPCPLTVRHPLTFFSYGVWFFRMQKPFKIYNCKSSIYRVCRPNWTFRSNFFQCFRFHFMIITYHIIFSYLLKNTHSNHATNWKSIVNLVYQNEIIETKELLLYLYRNDRMSQFLSGANWKWHQTRHRHCGDLWNLTSEKVNGEHVIECKPRASLGFRKLLRFHFRISLYHLDLLSWTHSSLSWRGNSERLSSSFWISVEWSRANTFLRSHSKYTAKCTFQLCCYSHSIRFLCSSNGMSTWIFASNVACTLQVIGVRVNRWSCLHIWMRE